MGFMYIVTPYIYIYIKHHEVIKYEFKLHYYESHHPTPINRLDSINDVLQQG